MIIVSVQLAPWDKIYEISHLASGQLIKPDDFKVGDQVIIKTDQGTDFGQVVKIEEKEVKEAKEERAEGIKIIFRKASRSDLEKIAKKQKSKKETIEKCEKLIKKHNLSMKLVDVLYSFDGGRITFAFTAPSRIDFRDLVKNLSQEFHKSIRLYQIGVRQEVGLAGDIGPCGRQLCCKSFLEKLGSVSTEFIFDQQIAHRGVDRLAGVCGRLKCCLAFEEDFYKDLIQKMPAVGNIVEVAAGEGRVVDWHILKQTVSVQINEGAIIDVPVDQIKMKDKK